MRPQGELHNNSESVQWRRRFWSTTGPTSCLSRRG